MNRVKKGMQKVLKNVWRKKQNVAEKNKYKNQKFNKIHKNYKNPKMELNICKLYKLKYELLQKKCRILWNKHYTYWKTKYET